MTKVKNKKKKTTAKRGVIKGKQFSTDYQPSGEAKSKGKKKSKLLKELLEMAFKGPKGSRLKKAAAIYMDIPEEELTVEDMLHFRQIERAIGKSNTFAYMAVMNRAHGLPKQKTELSGEGGSAIELKIVNIKATVPIAESEEDVS